MLTNEYTINGRTATGHEFMFGPGILGRLDPDEALVERTLGFLVHYSSRQPKHSWIGSIELDPQLENDDLYWLGELDVASSLHLLTELMGAEDRALRGSAVAAIGA